jgi:inosose dehydratase
MGSVIQTLAEIDALMACTDKNFVGLLYDSGHIAYAGEDYISIIKKYADRIPHVHLKDIMPDVLECVKREEMSNLMGVRSGVYNIPGEGCMDFKAIISAFQDIGYEGWMIIEVEMDPAKYNPLEYAIKAKKFMDSLLT